MAPISQSMPDLGFSNLKQHEDYYLRDGNICFLVEKTLFRLHRYFFERESDYFRTWLDSKDEDGSVDRPYIIHDMKSEEFAQFVWIWYNPRYSFSKVDKGKWLMILRLATRWRFDEIRQLAIRHLEKLELEPIEKITTYKQYSIDSELLLPSYVSLCRKEKLPSPEEGRRLTMETVLRIASARERAIIVASERGCRTPTTASVPEDVVQAIVAELFSELTLHSNDHDVRLEGQAVNDSNALNGSLMDTDVVTVRQPTRKGKESGRKMKS